MRSGQKQPLIEPPDNRTFFCLTELSFLIIILINTKDDELFGFYETDGDDIKTVPVYALFERIGEEKLGYFQREVHLQNYQIQNLRQITRKISNVRILYNKTTE
ncbi:unnamed protein product [Meloidogyne enterolobii]|uniref:Uncharacterized protein n=1 Tax=Meloidogyne enterolobii TaxID=390850 RepID=A0ACB0YHL8_MELEN